MIIIPQNLPRMRSEFVRMWTHEKSLLIERQILRVHIFLKTLGKFLKPNSKPNYYNIESFGKNLLPLQKCFR